MWWFIIVGCENQKVEETGQMYFGCFGAEDPAPLIVHGIPSAETVEPAANWHAHFQDGKVVDFEMGRATMGSVQLASDGTWGAVAQENGSIGLFRINNTEVDVINPEWFPKYEDSILYATHIWLDPRQDRLWIVDGNLSEKGGLYVAPIDCNTYTLNTVQQVFTAREGGPLSFVERSDFNTIFVAKSVNNGKQVLTFDRYDLSGPMTAFDAFPDDEGVYSAIASNGTDVLIADNNGSSTERNRVVHLDATTGNVMNTLAIEDPQSMIIQENWAIIAADSGNALHLYDLNSRVLTEIPTNDLVHRPFSIIENNNAIYTGEHNGIRKLILNEQGLVSEEMLLTESGSTRTIGPFGILGEW